MLPYFFENPTPSRCSDCAKHAYLDQFRERINGVSTYREGACMREASTLISCTRRIQFCAGHRILKHEGNCAMLHGHNYVLYVSATAEQLDELGRVVDFAVLKDRIWGWIQENWDHGCILAVEDEEAIAGVG